MTLQLDPQAQQLLSFVQQQTSRIGTQLEAQITQKATEVGAPLSKEQLEKLLIQAMPAHKDTISALGKKCMCHQPDGTNGAFVTQIVGLHMIEKERAAVYTAPTIVRPTRDPLTANFILAKDADVMLLFNASKFDASGRPLLMKIVARESMKDQLPDISHYHTLSKTPDVQYVANDAAYVSLKDENEAEFDFGDAIAQVSLDKAGKELSRNGAVGPKNERLTRYFGGMNTAGGVVPNPGAPANVAPLKEAGAQLDTSHVQRFEDRIQVSMAASSIFPAGGWLDVPASTVEAKLTLQPGYLLEPGSTASVSFASAGVAAAVAKDDFSFNGSASSEAVVNTAAHSGWTLGQLLRSNVRQITGAETANGADREVVDRPVHQLLFGHPERIQIGGANLDPLGDRVVKKADFGAANLAAHVEPLSGDPEKDGQEIVLDLAKGFLSGKDGQSMAGWRIEAGYFGGPSNAKKWISADPVKATADGSPASCLRIALPNAPEALASNTHLELRIYNAEGVPAQRVQIPLTELPWG